MSFIYQSRLFLIRLAKVLPFIVCSLVAVSYIETICSFSFSNFVVWSNYTIPYKPISWAIVGIAEYGWNTLAILAILSIAVETCICNKLSIAYLGLNLYEKNFFANIKLYDETVIVICIANIIVSSLLVYKGCKIYLRKQ